MNRLRKALIVAVSLTVSGLGNAEAQGAPPAESPAGTACPTSPLPPGMAHMPPIPMATSIKPSDTSTSTVIKPDNADQVRCGITPLKAVSDIAFAHVPGPGGQTRNLALDILAPAKPGKYPLVVYITGGGFVMAPKENGLTLRTHVAEQGFVVASIQYRTFLDDANYRDGVADVKSAIRFLRAHAAEYGIDPSRVSVWGESAGGYLAAMVGVTNGAKEFDRGDNLDQSSAVQAVVDKFGTSDTASAAEDFNPEMAGFVGPGSPVNRYLTDGGVAFPPAANPMTYIKRTDPPFLIFHGNNDRIVSPSQTLKLHNALRAAGVSSKRYIVDGAGHGDLAFIGDAQAGLPWSTNEVMRVIVRFLRDAR